MNIRLLLQRARHALALLGTAAALSAGALTAAGAPAASAASTLPCDVYAAGGTSCVAAYSTVRALYASYNGPLYQVQRSSDNSTLNIGLLAAGGYVNAAPQVPFCSGTTCTITKIYDQGPSHSDLPVSWGGFWHGPGPGGADVGANAMALPVTIAGHQAYGVRVTPGTGYRVDNIPLPTGSQPEGVYMVTSSNLYNSQCCFDFGSGETSHDDTGNGHMNAIEWGSACWFGGCTGSGPWVEADLENGMYSTSRGPNNADNPGVHYPFVSAWEKNNGTSNFTLKYGNATTGGLTTTWSGALPNGYSPMHEEADILLGTGGDNSNGASGEFFEGAITAGYPSDATENAVQAGLTTTGYGSSAGANTVTVTSPGDQSGTVGTAASTQIHASDSASGQTLTYSATGLPAGLSISSSTGLISGTPTTAGTFSVTVTAADGTGASGSAAFTWTISSGGTGGGTCRVAYTTASQWAGGFVANVTITNTGTSAVSGWTLAFTFPGDQHITNGWNGTASQAGQNVTITNASYNAAIAAGASTSLGFQGTWTSSDTPPAAFTLNGTACTTG
jgi:non-reducing end alpha-L-arabinofuranosidase